MRILIAPMAAMAETSGPFSRAAALCNKLIERKHTVAFCAAEDINYRSIENVKNYYAPIPSPFGAPKFIGKTMLKIAQFMGVQEKKKVNSYEQVLHFVGAISKKHFYEDVSCIRKAIQEFQPDVVYAEFRIAAIVAAKLENVKVITGYSYPVQKTFASNPEYCTGVKEFLKENNLPEIESALDIFNWADLKVVPSSYELEPIDGENIVFTGPFVSQNVTTSAKERNKIIAYMGFGSINPNILIDSLTKAFEQTDFEVYIATEQVNPFKRNNINVDRRFDFRKLMPEAAVYINHGGQNSIMTSLLYGIPQIVCPGNVFERRYNAASVVNLGAGVLIEKSDFNADKIKSIVNEFNSNSSYADNAKKAGQQLSTLGGVDKAADIIESCV